MATNKHEINLLLETARDEGARTHINYDDNDRIDSITIIGLNGMSDKYNENGILTLVESLRDLIGKKAASPLVSTPDGVRTLTYTDKQMKAYGSIDYLASVRVMSGSERLNSKFKIVEKETGKAGYYVNLNGDAHKFGSKEEFDLHNDNEVSVELNYANFDISTKEGQLEYKKHVRELNYLNIYPVMLDKEKFKETMLHVGTAKVDYSNEINSTTERLNGTEGKMIPMWEETIDGSIVHVVSMDTDNEFFKNLCRNQEADIIYC